MRLSNSLSSNALYFYLKFKLFNINFYIGKLNLYKNTQNMNLCSGIQEHIALLSLGTLLIAAKNFNLFESVVDFTIYLNNKHSEG